MYHKHRCPHQQIQCIYIFTQSIQEEKNHIESILSEPYAPWMSTQNNLLAFSVNYLLTGTYIKSQSQISKASIPFDSHSVKAFSSYPKLSITNLSRLKLGISHHPYYTHEWCLQYDQWRLQPPGLARGSSCPKV